MDMILTKILAAFLALSLVTTRPDSIKTAFDPATDAAEVTAIMRDGCGHMREAFDVESLDLDDLIKTAMDDPGAISAEIKPLHGLKFDSLLTVYRQFCKNENVKDSPVDLAEPDLVDLWRNIACPILFVNGKESWASNPEKDGRMKHFRDGRVVEFERAGHWVHHDRLDAFMETVRAFL